MADQFGRSGAQLVTDAATHEHDIRGALGRPGARDSDAVEIAFQYVGDAVGDDARRRRTRCAGRPSRRRHHHLRVRRAHVRVADHTLRVPARHDRTTECGADRRLRLGRRRAERSRPGAIHRADRSPGGVGQVPSATVDLSSSFGPFRHRRFALLWAGAFVSNIGTWMEAVGVGILVTTSTGQAGWAGLVAAAGFVPTALLAPLGGALADRVPRRTLLLATTSFQILFAGLLTLAASVGDPSPGLVTLLVLGRGVRQRDRLPRVPGDAPRPRAPRRRARRGGALVGAVEPRAGDRPGPRRARDRPRRLRARVPRSTR